ncbi:hypothetical protein PENSTE_c012G00792 [Penicillium steckii]|uniref:Uncharacterized protein n=1 Tax=Penicillium steckii TaxID=303698 RepID=A0A1V6T4R1_9EURO|nr:hypothetical protein PENSTE_c012G00792 [Penicillium steckii]
MERVRKTLFNPLVKTKDEVKKILEDLPIGSAHPFSPEKILLCQTGDGIIEIDISSYPEEFFFNAVDLDVFKDFQIMQAPDATFKIPIVSDEITILAVSERNPTYWDFCFADESCNACCWLARDTFPGITHSGDIENGSLLLDFVRINRESLTEREICVFISGYTKKPITRFTGTHPALLVADHVDKILYIVPVPLDAATIGDATICCPLVIKRDDDSLICSILPAATTDRDMYCRSDTLDSPAFPEAIKRANFTLNKRAVTKDYVPKSPEIDDTAVTSGKLPNQDNAIFITRSALIPSFIDQGKVQIVRFGTGLEFESNDNKDGTDTQPSAVVLPCIFGSQLQGPILLATGTVPSDMPFADEITLLKYYAQLKSAMVMVDEKMTDNARNLASNYRLNALFIVQLTPEVKPKDSDAIISLMNAANINAVTALAGPQSLVLVQVFDKYYFYRGIANRTHLNTSGLAFGTDLTSLIETVDIESILDPRVPRIIDLSKGNKILLPSLPQLVRPKDLQGMFEQISIEKMNSLEDDILAAAPQLQALLDQKELQELSKSLIFTLSEKVSKKATPLRRRYTHFLTTEFDVANANSKLKKDAMLGELRKVTKNAQRALEPVISCLANLTSSQTTSKRTHDLNRLLRQTTIQNNIESAKSMTSDTLSGYLEEYAADMGVLLINLDTEGFKKLLGDLKNTQIDAKPCCTLDSRVLHLEGFDAGIIMQQSQSHHDGPLQRAAGSTQPIMAMPYLSQLSGSGSMLAWVCWDEFVNLTSPYKVRWMEKCNEPHIAAVRILMRDTLSQGVASKEHNINQDSLETGPLMSALLMAAMSKLAAMRTTAPVELRGGAEDTVTKLMRGLFGNLLTIAGSGVRPLSMVWQLFGLHPQFDVPTTPGEWAWYETVVALYPYTGWPMAQFLNNLEKLLNKVIVRVVTKNEKVEQIQASRKEDMINFRELRNIQLKHSRLIVTVFTRMLGSINEHENVDSKPQMPAVAERLLANIPHTLGKQTSGYGDMIKYINNLAQDKPRNTQGNSTILNTFTRRAAHFAELKQKVGEACKAKNWEQAREFCRAIEGKVNDLVTLWNVPPEWVKVQNIRSYKALLAADLDQQDDDQVNKENLKLINRIIHDIEIIRTPWKIGIKGRDVDLQPLDENLIQEILTGERVDNPTLAPSITPGIETDITPIEDQQTTIQKQNDGFLELRDSFKDEFVEVMQNDLSFESVCEIINVPVSTMQIFIQKLNPDFDSEKFGINFKEVILELCKNRSNRVESQPVRKLLQLDGRRLQVEG